MFIYVLLLYKLFVGGLSAVDLTYTVHVAVSGEATPGAESVTLVVKLSVDFIDLPRSHVIQPSLEVPYAPSASNQHLPCIFLGVLMVCQEFLRFRVRIGSTIVFFHLDNGGIESWGFGVWCVIGICW